MFVTSFSQDGYTQYGRAFLESYVAHCNIPIIVYCEGLPPVDSPPYGSVTEAVDTGLIEFRNLFDVEPCMKWLMKVAKILECQGKVFEEGKPPTYNYRFDAYKFARKVFVVYDAWAQAIPDIGSYEDLPTKEMAWIDADCIVHSDVPDTLIADTLTYEGKRNTIAFLGRNNWYSECGYMAFDLTQDDLGVFMEIYRNLYLSGAFMQLPEYHDCMMFDHARKISFLTSVNINPDPTYMDHPFIISVLGKYFDHLKGPRKQAGVSPELSQRAELLKPKEEGDTNEQV